MKRKAYLLLTGMLLFLSTSAFALTANKVHFEIHPTFFRVKIQYTLPELKEFREVEYETTSYKKANAFYWKVVRGAEFEIGSPDQVRFINPTKTPDPW